MKTEEIIKRIESAIKNYNPWPEQTYGGDSFYEEITKILNELKNNNMNPNNIKIGDVIEVEQAWEDEQGTYHDEFPTVTSINGETGELKLDFGRKETNEFLDSAEYFAKDYTPKV